MPFVLEYNEIQKILPQRFPFALIDRVIDFKKGESLVALKTITANEWPLAQGHASPVTDHTSLVYPRSLLIEAAAQAALLLYHLSMVKEGENPRYVLGRVKGEFLNDVRSGEVIVVYSFATKLLRAGGVSDITITSGSAQVGTLTLVFKVER